ncbi:hypothetical protein B0H17DRAFT_1235013 [Mycena rosella]|uniref:Uncharacterized protein n=1 Tax=Mycena rosella TaxID=1033263 RepID=A0AAD7D4X4_MYCRO|nr:hypothetical protein B0H17DRAFT_1235013 [Mycena rosella]
MADINRLDFTTSGDGTSHKHLNYESRFIDVNQKLLAVGLTQAPNHTSEEQLAGWQNIVDEMYEIYNASPLGKLHPEDPRSFFVKATGMMTDDSADQEKLRALFLALKQRMDREVRGDRALLHLTTPKLLDAIYDLTGQKIEARGGWQRGTRYRRLRGTVSTVLFMRSFVNATVKRCSINYPRWNKRRQISSLVAAAAQRLECAQRRC